MSNFRQWPSCIIYSMSNFRQWPSGIIYSMSNFRQWPSGEIYSMSNFRQWPISRIYSMSNFRQWPSGDNHSSFLIPHSSFRAPRARLLPYPFFIPHFPHSSHQDLSVRMRATLIPLGVRSAGSVTSFSYKPIIRARTREHEDETY